MQLKEGQVILHSSIDDLGDKCWIMQERQTNYDDARGWNRVSTESKDVKSHVHLPMPPS